MDAGDGGEREAAFWDVGYEALVVGARVRKVESGGWMVVAVLGELESEVRERGREGLVGVDILMFVCLFVGLVVERERGADGWLCLYEDGERTRGRRAPFISRSRGNNNKSCLINKCLDNKWRYDTAYCSAVGGRSRRYGILMYKGVFRAAISHWGTRRGVVIAPRLV
jgi:Rad3-related DNA helicase